jgi:hypothetical protein
MTQLEWIGSQGPLGSPLGHVEAILNGVVIGSVRYADVPVR